MDCVSLPGMNMLRGGEAAWHIVAVDHPYEQAAAAGMRALPDFQALVPLVRVLIPQSNRPAIRKLMVAFPGYVLALWAPGAPWHKLREIDHVAGVLHQVGERERPAEVDPVFMFRLLAALSPQGVLEDDRSVPDRERVVAKGEQVRVHALGQELAGVCDAAGDRRVSVLLGQIRLTVPRHRVEPAA